MINASIITIGDELLIGQVIDTNSAWIAQQLNKIGISVCRRVAVGDTKDAITNALNEEQKNAQIILLTGGLGPTADDITKPLLCDSFGGKMIVDENVKKHVVTIFTRLNRPILERNLKQAEVPNCCTVIHNARGTAPGMLFKKDNCIFISMPGVPEEMKGLMNDFVLDYLQKQFELPFIVHRTMLTAGLGESFIAEKIINIEEQLPAHIKLAYLPNYSMVRLRLSGTGTDKQNLENEIDSYFVSIKNLLQEFIVAESDETMEAVVAKLLLSKNKTIGTAESCTGGYISHLITSMAGSSSYYKGSVIAYAYDAKEDLLGVDKTELETKGAVSEQIVTQMVKGTLKNLKVDYAIAVSGIMGPGGATADKPVGTVWIAVGNNKHIDTQKMFFRFDRAKNIQLTAVNALNLMRKFILENECKV